MENEDNFDFVDEDPAEQAPLQAPWKVLVVDDDDQVHAITRVVFRGLSYQGRPVQLVSAMSAAAARACLAEHADFALALIDVVMETEHSGLELVQHIRDVLGNRTIRLILRTGQPGHAPEADVIVNYEIDDYKAKTELTAQKLVTAVIASLRAYAYISEIAALNANLEAMVAMRTAELEKLAMLDPLTGAGNRRHLEQRGAVEVAQMQRLGQCLAVVAFDIDHFKQVNDRYSHAAGDAVLCQVVQTVKSALRAGDFLARTGGEEFILLLPDQDLALAAQVAERLRALVAATPMQIEGGSLQVSASFGVSLVAADGQLGQAIEHADQALYRSKHGGRNRVSVHEALA